MKLIIQKKINLNIEQAQNGIQAILRSNSLHKINWFDNIFESDILLKIKFAHNDSIDAMVFYSAVVNCDVLATFDETLIERMHENQEIIQFIKEVNPKFKIWLKNLENPPIPLIDF